MIRAGRCYEDLVAASQREFHGENVRGRKSEPVSPAKKRTGVVDEKTHRH